EISPFLCNLGDAGQSRLIFLGQHRIAGLATIVGGQVPDNVGSSEMTSAWHSRLGDVRSRLRWADPVSTECLPGDPLYFECDPPDSMRAPDRDLILVSRGYYSTFRDNSTGTSSDLGAFVNSVGQLYPNPFGQSVSLSLELRQPGAVRVLVYDASGRLVR